MSKTVKIVGPFFTNYSLARVNRGFARGINSLGTEFEAKLFVTQEESDYYPTDEELDSRPEIKEIFSKEDFFSDFAIYNNFPKNTANPLGLTNLNARIKLIYVAWEESIYPSNWVEEINAEANGVMTISSFTRDILFNSGVRVPIFVVPCALDQEYFDSKLETFTLNTQKSFKFLHVSSGKKRKGVDVLLKAYFSSFTNQDDVTLIIKSSPGPDNDIDRIIGELSSETSPEVIHINNPEVSEQDMKNLHHTASAEVYPSRSEGFGIPVLESMFYGKPVIATAYSGYLDFLNEDNGHLVDYQLVPTSDSELVNIGARWAEPDTDDLARKMRFVYENKDSIEVTRRAIKAQKVATDYTWENAGEKAVEFFRNLEEAIDLKQSKILVVSPYNDETGIAEYSEKIYSNVANSFKEFKISSNIDLAKTTKPDEEFVVRNWSLNDSTFKDLEELILSEGFDIVHFQYHPGAFTSPQDFNNLLQNISELNNALKFFVTLHAVKGSGFDLIEDIPNLKLCTGVFMHNHADVDYAREKGLNNVSFLPLYKTESRKRSKTWLRKRLNIPETAKILATHGLLNTNKGIQEIIKASAVLKEKGFELLCLNAVSQNNIYAGEILKECKSLISELGLENNVRFITDFLPEDHVMAFLEASDYIVFNYSDAGESASAAVNKGLSSRNPVIITNIPQFSEFNEECFRMENNKAENIVDAILTLEEDTDLKTRMLEHAAKYIEKNSNHAVALKQLVMISSNLAS